MSIFGRGFQTPLINLSGGLVFFIFFYSYLIRKSTNSFTQHTLIQLIPHPPSTPCHSLLPQVTLVCHLHGSFILIYYLCMLCIVRFQAFPSSMIMHILNQDFEVINNMSKAATDGNLVSPARFLVCLAKHRSSAAEFEYLNLT